MYGQHCFTLIKLWPSVEVAAQNECVSSGLFEDVIDQLLDLLDPVVDVVVAVACGGLSHRVSDVDVHGHTGHVADLTQSDSTHAFRRQALAVDEYLKSDQQH